MKSGAILRCLQKAAVVGSIWRWPEKPNEKEYILKDICYEIEIPLNCSSSSLRSSNLLAHVPDIQTYRLYTKFVLYIIVVYFGSLFISIWLFVSKFYSRTAVFSKSTLIILYLKILAPICILCNSQTVFEKFKENESFYVLIVERNRNN